MTSPVNREFEIRGVNHLALVCKDMARTVEFYRDVLGMPLVKTLDLPGGRGQHFFFDIGNGDTQGRLPDLSPARSTWSRTAPLLLGPYRKTAPLDPAPYLKTI
jgi:catechol 2,3-dioxygenase-like lactoylglutathione lyase family enzyme